MDIHGGEDGVDLWQFPARRIADTVSGMCRNIFETMDYSSSDLRINSNQQKEIEPNKNNNSDKAEKETNCPTTSSAIHTPAPRSGGEVSEFHSVKDISISRNNSQTNQDRIENSVTDKTVCNNSVQTEFPQILAPLPQRK